LIVFVRVRRRGNFQRKGEPWQPLTPLAANANGRSRRYNDPAPAGG